MFPPAFQRTNPSSSNFYDIRLLLDIQADGVLSDWNMEFESSVIKQLDDLISSQQVDIEKLHDKYR